MREESFCVKLTNENKVEKFLSNVKDSSFLDRG